MNSAAHLTDDQIDDHLIGDLHGEAVQHLAGCAECQDRVAEMEAPISSFKDVSLAWGERQSATMPVRPAGLRTKTNHGRRAIWAATATAAVAIGVAIPLARHEAHGTTPAAPHASTHTQTFAAEREEQIAQDNQMLLDIDRELGTPVSSPSETFGFDLNSEARRSAHNGSVRD